MTLIRSVAVASLVLSATFVCAAELPPKNDLNHFKLLDVRGERHDLAANEHRRGTAFVFLSSECPISRQYIPELNRLAKAVPGNKIAFYGVLADPSVTRRNAVKFVDEFHVAFPILFDGSLEVACTFGPTTVPEAFLVDSTGSVVYRGRIDDLYTEIGKHRPTATEHDLLAAMTALADGRLVPRSKTESVGCPFETPREVKTSAQVTYARDIAPILFAHCAECHRPGEVAPFSLLTYDDAAKRAKFLARITGSRRMPPWKADRDSAHFLDERRLTEPQIALIKAWAAAGAPRGDDADLPPQPKFASGWRLGTPDLVAKVPVPFTMPADGPDIFQHFVIPLDLVKNETIIGYEFRPGNSSIVHHAIVFLDSSGRARQRDAETPEPGWRTSGSIDAGVTSMVGVWTPGMTPRLYPEDVGIPIEKGTDVVVQLHLHPSGKTEIDQSRIGLYFAKKPVKKTMSRSPLVMGTLIIEVPPGEKRYRTGSSLTLPVDLTVTSVFPHMHLIGKEMKVTATRPDGGITPLIWIKDWNFYWQDSYVYNEPIRLPKGTRIDIEAYYDNSASNPFNPSKPPKRVLFGNESTDEMCFAVFQSVAGEQGSARRMGGSVMRSFMKEYQTAPLSPDARLKILAEAMKLFGGRRGGPPPAKSKAAKPKTAETKSASTK